MDEKQISYQVIRCIATCCIPNNLLLSPSLLANTTVEAPQGGQVCPSTSSELDNGGLFRWFATGYRKKRAKLYIPILRASLIKIACVYALALSTTTNAQTSSEANVFDAYPTHPPLTLTSFEDLTPANTQNDIPYEALRTFVDVFDAIKKYYVADIDNRELVENAIKGMLTRLDPHSLYMTDDEYHNFQMLSEGEYAGIGVVLDIKNGSMQVVSAIENSPAQRAGLKSGDIISQVDGQNVAELTLSEASQLMSGEEGSEVSIILVRDDKVYEYRFTREIITTNSVSSKMLDSHHALIRISQFQDDTSQALAQSIEDLKTTHSLKGIILDLRNNPGGLLTPAIDSSNLFLNQGNILTIRGRDNSPQEIFSAQAGDILSGAPIVILVDQGSASSAEIMAAALRDNQRALVVGQPTFGKGSVQTITPLYHGGAVKMTTAHYFTPAGESLQVQGVIPQVHLTPLSVVEDRNQPVGNLRETALPRYLRNPNAPVKPTHIQANNQLAKNDFSLYEALNILKTMSLMQNLQRPSISSVVP